MLFIHAVKSRKMVTYLLYAVSLGFPLLFAKKFQKILHIKEETGKGKQAWMGTPAPDLYISVRGRKIRGEEILAPEQVLC